MGFFAYVPLKFQFERALIFCDINLQGFLMSNVAKFSPSLIGVKDKHHSCNYLSLHRSHLSVISFVVYTCYKAVSQNYHKKWVKSIKSLSRVKLPVFAQASNLFHPHNCKGHKFCGIYWHFCLETLLPAILLHSMLAW